MNQLGKEVNDNSNPDNYVWYVSYGSNMLRERFNEPSDTYLDTLHRGIAENYKDMDSECYNTCFLIEDEGQQYYYGKLWIPDDLETMEL